MKRLILLLLVLTPGTAGARAASSIRLAEGLGSLLASEAQCDLAYDQTAIQNWIAKNVPAEDMAFASNLQVMTRGAERQGKSMTPSQRTAHCAAIALTARRYGFIK